MESLLVEGQRPKSLRLRRLLSAMVQLVQAVSLLDRGLLLSRETTLREQPVHLFLLVVKRW
ncbi:hypothetical protein P298_04040 [Salmonella enterica subsp. arizonae serovar 18:z4,z23:- str. CVM N26626]|uniref:Uncharacterized protein n=1 Tax=Salmonella enterica subsp. arizonae serovar 18:z4,z23:- str. CVM N26626 TaxID=1395119 RepID=A0A3S5YE66_SALER|nr:hypothetical protein P298_04040 [Salmonella enterica subsp. arizonae serovar 18:z4,z23:- str. CVM N26626]OLV97032.1 hypothetical protein P297_17630 [Salmonella enterica subsp. arizonae serovar 18:z4,z23:- str. CVM N26625]OLW06653.1 hypothetical protein P292_08300 [Salmonella enterica subsp. arizonae serovar 18:z4,z23:- str. CVM N18554]OLW20048.1 hypothetical protein P291_18350 [Salmonella enterica subsp. arizonae serovar 18:z4,z23:- str. CVM N18503]OLW33164.1 hypothetical protein P287_20975 